MDSLTNIIRKHGYTLIASAAVLIFFFYPNIGIYDWDKEIVYCDFIRGAFLDHGAFPMFIWNRGRFMVYPAVAQSAFFAGNPETLLLSPFVPLLLILPSITFLKLLVVIHFIIGWFGVQKLGRACAWQVQQARIFTALFFLSPIVFQHIAIGYLPWVNLFLLPWLFYFMIQSDFIRRSIGAGLVLALMLLQGGLHVFVWAVLLLAFFQLFSALLNRNLKDLFSVLVTGFSACVLALPRLITSYQVFGEFEQKFFSGYSMPAFLKWALIPPFFTPRTMDDIEFFIEGYIDGVPYWDGNLFWGFLLICVFLLPFALLNYNKHEDNALQGRDRIDILAFSAASFVILLLSFNGIYEDVISFASDLVGFPALKGMEKYPFRFAIPAYFGFAFVTAWLWKDFINLFKKVFQFLKKACYLLMKKFDQLAEKLKNNKKKVAWMAGTVVVLCTAVLVLNTRITGWMLELVAAAYAGEGAKILGGLMENVDTVPLQLYQSKALALFSIFRRAVLTLAAVFCLFWLISLNKKTWKPGEKRIRKVKGVFPEWAPEVLIVLPLMLAFGMWWRVALATPVASFSGYIDQEPLVRWADANDDSDLPAIGHTPASLEVFASKEMVGKKLVFTEISHSDARFLESEQVGVNFSNVNGKAALEIHNSGLIRIQAQYDPLLFSAAPAAVGWIAAAWILLRKKQTKYGI